MEVPKQLEVPMMTAGWWCIAMALVAAVVLVGMAVVCRRMFGGTAVGCGCLPFRERAGTTEQGSGDPRAENMHERAP